jgi:hypothetical protein
MNQAIVRREYFSAMPSKQAAARFMRVNQNPNNDYRSGFEFFMNYFPVIHGHNDPFKAKKLSYIQDVIADLAERLLQEPWIVENWPMPTQMLNRVVLAIDDLTGAELVLVRWNKGETPIHGHDDGQMIDYLVRGRAIEVEYKVIDEATRSVKEISRRGITQMNPILNGFFDKSAGVHLSAMIHQFVAICKCVTLHLVPAHPRDGRGNTFNKPKL